MMTTLILSFLFACTGEDAVVVTPEAEVAPEVATEVVEVAPVADTVADGVTKAVAIADAIEKEPTRADAILAEHGTTREAYEASLFDIASDSTQSAAYAKARSN